jgi:hypothetical protein
LVFAKASFVTKIITQRKPSQIPTAESLLSATPATQDVAKPPVAHLSPKSDAYTPTSADMTESTISTESPKPADNQKASTALLSPADIVYKADGTTILAIITPASMKGKDLFSPVQNSDSGPYIIYYGKRRNLVSNNDKLCIEAYLEDLQISSQRRENLSVIEGMSHQGMVDMEAILDMLHSLGINSHSASGKTADGLISSTDSVQDIIRMILAGSHQIDDDLPAVERQAIFFQAMILQNFISNPLFSSDESKRIVIENYCTEPAYQNSPLYLYAVLKSQHMRYEQDVTDCQIRQELYKKGESNNLQPFVLVAEIVDNNNPLQVAINAEHIFFSRQCNQLALAGVNTDAAREFYVIYNNDNHLLTAQVKIGARLSEEPRSFELTIVNSLGHGIINHNYAELVLPSEYLPTSQEYCEIRTNQQDSDINEPTTCGLRAVKNAAALMNGVGFDGLPKESESQIRAEMAQKTADYYQRSTFAELTAQVKSAALSFNNPMIITAEASLGRYI